jgi:hypothetical protein
LIPFDTLDKGQLQWQSRLEGQARFSSSMVEDPDGLQ